MAETKLKRTKKKQMGQFMTPIERCKEILKNYTFSVNDKILEPSFGDGNFLITLIKKFLPLYAGHISERLTKILNNNIYGIELDSELLKIALSKIEKEFGFLPPTYNLFEDDYLVHVFDLKFNYIIGNPPFGGTINPDYDKELEKKYGKRNDHKIKKETYSFFIIKSVEHLTDDGKLIFISSDTFLTIKTMSGLRRFLFENGYSNIQHLAYFSDETNYPMVILTFNKGEHKDYITLDDTQIDYDSIIHTDNFSWNIPLEYVKYFKSDKLSKYIIGTGGMTTGKNEYFLRDIVDGTIIEPYNFTFFEDSITLDAEINKARLNKLSDQKISEIKKQEEKGETRRNVRIRLKQKPETIKLPNDNYCFYNKANNKILYSKPDTMIFWKDNGDSCITFKKNGNWYLHGVGGMPFFKREGITWQLISSSIKARYLPEGYILDSGAPIIVLKDGINNDELYFILGWLLTNKATEILKNVINHTKNIQSKDIERLPYPFWVNQDNKSESISYIRAIVKSLMDDDNSIPDDFKDTIEKLYA